MKKFSISTCPLRHLPPHTPRPNSEFHHLLSQKSPGVDWEVGRLFMGKPSLITHPMLINMFYMCLKGRGRYTRNLPKLTVTSEKSILLVLSPRCLKKSTHHININPRRKGLVFFQSCLSPWSSWIPTLVSHSNSFIIKQLLYSLSLSFFFFFLKFIFAETSGLSKTRKGCREEQ